MTNANKRPAAKQNEEAQSGTRQSYRRGTEDMYLTL